MIRMRSLASTGLLFLSLSVPGAQASEWSIGIYTGAGPTKFDQPRTVNNPVLTFRDVTDVSASFVADPFIVVVNGTYHMFFEVLNTANGRGEIGHATSPNGTTWTYDRIVLREAFHLSYPNVFQVNGTWYMLPEAGDSGSVRLYRATTFPTTWVFDATLMSGTHWRDNSLLFLNNTWYLFTSPDVDDTLELYTSSDMRGPYTRHPKSPLVTGNASTARGGGPVINTGGHIYRYAQDDYPNYGRRVHAFEITTLTPTDYAEALSPDDPAVAFHGCGWAKEGMHQIAPLQQDPTTWIAAVDGYGDSAVNSGLGKTDWKLQYVDSQELVGENGAATNAFDEVCLDYWHTQWYPSVAPLPHEIQIDLGARYSVSGFRYVPRQDGGTNGRIANYEFYVSDDPTAYGTAAATGTFDNNADFKIVNFAAKRGRYVRLRALTEAAGGQFTTASEIDVFGGPPPVNQAPDGRIDSPAADVTITQGQSVSFAGTGTDPDNDVPLAYRWNFGTGSGVPDATLEDPGSITFNNVGTFTVSFTVTDAQGLADPTPATRRITVQSPNQAPNGRIDSPSADAKINAGEAVKFLGSGSDPDGNTPLKYRWNFGANSGIPDSTSEDPGPVTYKTAGTYTVTLTVTDARGLADPTPATRTITVSGTNPSGPLSRSGWSLRYVDSEEYSWLFDGRGRNALDGDNWSLWCTKYSGFNDPDYPHEMQIDLGQVRTIDGFRYLPRQDFSTRGRVANWEFYVSDDGVNWGPAQSTGTFANSFSEKEARFPAVTGRYVRFRALSEVYGGRQASAAEIKVLGR